MSTAESWLEVQLARVFEDAELTEQGMTALAMVTALADRAEQIRALNRSGCLGRHSQQIVNGIARQGERLERRG